MMIITMSIIIGFLKKKNTGEKKLLGRWKVDTEVNKLLPLEIKKKKKTLKYYNLM